MANALVVLNGPSSAGKTTLAKALRAQLGTNATHVAIDRLFAFMHPDVRHDWRVFSALTDATFASAAALAAAGYSVIVDTVFERADCIASMRRAFGDRPYRLVGLTCSADELDARERARGDRPVGLARGQRDRVFHDVRYDLMLDTQATPVEACVARVLALL